MELGQDEPAIVIEPVEEPGKRDVPEPEEAPVEVPAEPEKVPA